MKVLRGEINRNSDGEDRDAITVRYTDYMNGTGEDSCVYHLYTTWNGSDVSSNTSKNHWVEFRIIQVGEHDGDGSVVTFMACHVLPTAKYMNKSDTNNTTSWSGSEMRSTLNNKNGYGMTGLSDLVESKKAKAITKMEAKYNSVASDWFSDARSSDTEDTFWLLSYSEITGKEYSDSNIRKEGNQYSWFNSKNISENNSNVYLKYEYKTRAGSNPDSTYGYLSKSWWLRSPMAYDDEQYDYYNFAYINGDGNPTCISEGYLPCGVVPAFCF